MSLWGLLGLVSVVSGAQPVKLADLDSTPRELSSSPSGFAPVDGGFLFAARPSQREPSAVWRSDGTDGGTVRLTASDWSWRPFVPPRAVDGRWVFTSAFDLSLNAAVLVTDGTAQGTQILQSRDRLDTFLGLSRAGALFGSRAPLELIAVSFDGGTRVIDSNEQGFGAGYLELAWAGAGALVRRLAADGGRSTLLYDGDGGVSRFNLELVPGFQDPFRAVSALSAPGSTTVVSLKVGPGLSVEPLPCGVAGATALGGINPGIGRDRTTDGLRSVFQVFRAGEWAWFTTDGTAAGTVGLSPTSLTSEFLPLAFGGRLYSLTARETVWRGLDGQSSGVVASVGGGGPLFALNGRLMKFEGPALLDLGPLGEELRSFDTGLRSGGGEPLPFGSRVYFRGSAKTVGEELFSTDGNSVSLVADLVQGTTSFSPSRGFFVGGALSFLNPTGSTLCSLADGGLQCSPRLAPSQFESYVLKGDPLASSAGVLVSLNLLGFRGSFIRSLAGALALDGGVTELVDEQGGALLQQLDEFVPFGAEVLVVAQTRTVGQELFITGGPPGTVRRLRQPSATGGSSSPSRPVVSGALAFFVASDDEGRTLWVTDGTPQGTQRLVPPQDALAAAYLSSIVPVSGAGVAFAATGPNGRQLYVSDGTAAGTRALGSGGLTPPPRALTPLGGAGDTVVATGEFSNGRALLLIPRDGGAWGRVPLWSGAINAPRVLGQLGDGGLVFVAEDATTGSEPYFTDGTAQGTRLLADLSPGPAGASVGASLAVRDAVYFVATTLDAGQELFRTDGLTVELASDVSPGRLDSRPSGLLWSGARLIFSACDVNDDCEPHVLPLAPVNDNSPPQVLGRALGVVSDAGWFTSEVSIAFGAFEPDSPFTSVGCDGGVQAFDTAGSSLTCTVTSIGGTGSATVQWRRDATAPTLTCPSEVTLQADDAGVAVAGWEASARDNLDPAPRLTSTQPLGGTLGVGRTPVTLTATDAAGNVARCQFDVVVNQPATTTVEPSPRTPTGCGCANPGGGLLWASLLACCCAALRRPRRRR